MKKSIFLLFSLFLLTGCSTKESENQPTTSSPPTEKSIELPTSQYIPETSPCDENVFNPVCAEIKIQCLEEPCETVWQDFPNRCQAEKLSPINIENGICPPEKGGILPPAVDDVGTIDIPSETPPIIEEGTE
jgi:PBP1b-binding outer membrane lipoprotein LpoB